jgi:hypothetical protein
MRFSDRAVQKARWLRQLGLPWEPRPGHYVFDEHSLIEKRSPFQEGVYFILDLKHFLRRAGTMETLKESFTWLLTWHDAREMLQALGVSDANVAGQLAAKRAIENREELPVLYEILGEQLGRSPD